RNVGAHVDFGKGVEALRQALARPQHAQRGGRCGPRKKQAASQDHIVDDPEAREDAGKEEHQCPFEEDAVLGEFPCSLQPSAAAGHADGVQMDGDTSLGIGEPVVDERKGTRQVVGTPEGQVNDKEGATEVISQAGAAMRVGCLDVRGAEMKATGGPVEVAPLSEDVVRGQTATETEAVRLTEPVVPPPLASGPRWWKQDVGEVSAKVHEDPVMQGRFSSTDVDEEVHGRLGGGGSQGQGSEEAAGDDFACPSILAQMDRSIEAQRRIKASHMDELAKMPALRAQELTVALRCGAAGAADDAKAHLRAAVDQRHQAAARFDGKITLFEQRREALQRAVLGSAARVPAARVAS
ncbi:unnamed protein product, partial [Prorocentrum cordatum]